MFKNGKVQITYHIYHVPLMMRPSWSQRDRPPDGMNSSACNVGTKASRSKSRRSGMIY